MPPKKGQLVKRRKTETRDILAPQYWFKTDTDKNKDEQQKVLLLLLARKKARSSPFYHKKLPTDAFQTILAWIPTVEDCDKIYSRITKMNELCTGLLCKQYIPLEVYRYGETVPNERIAEVYFILSWYVNNGDEERDALDSCIRYNPNHKSAYLHLINLYHVNKKYEEAENCQKKYMRLLGQSKIDKYRIDYLNMRAFESTGDYTRGIEGVDNILDNISKEPDMDARKNDILELKRDLRDVKARCCVGLENWDLGIEILLAESRPGIRPLMLISKCYFHKGDVSKAIKYAAKAYTTGTRDAAKSSSLERIARQLRQYTSVATKEIEPAKIEWIY